MTTLSLRDRRHQQAQKDCSRLERQRDETIARLTRIVERLKVTRRSIERYERTPTLTPAPRPAAVAAAAVVEPPATMPEPTPYRPGESLAAKIDDALHGVETDHLSEPAFQKLATAMEKKSEPPFELEIPEWLKRAGPIGDKTPTELKDLEARAAIEVENANRRIAKSRARIDKMKAKERGDLKRMPLTGKAALAAIRKG